MMRSWKSALCSLGLLLGMSCGVDDRLEGAADHVLAEQGPEPRSRPLYFGVRADLRRCAAPTCGGSFIRALNSEQTTCADGSKAAECYVAELDLRAFGLSDAQTHQLVREQDRLVVVGVIRPSERHGDGFGSLAVEQAYRGVNDTPVGSTLLTTSTGIVCFTAPCPTHQGLLVNQGHQLKFDPNLDTLKATPGDLELVKRAFAKDGVLLSGRLAEPMAPTGVDALLEVTQAYLRVGDVREYGSGRPHPK
jgi:hypothetical protein